MGAGVVPPPNSEGLLAPKMEGLVVPNREGLLEPKAGAEEAGGALAPKPPNPPKPPPAWICVWEQLTRKGKVDEKRHKGSSRMKAIKCAKATACNEYTVRGIDSVGN